MTIYAFEMEGPLYGYRAGLTRVWDPNYKLFKERVRLTANVARVPGEIPSDRRLGIQISIRWKKKARIDGSNILKAVEDALFRQDRALGNGSWVMVENTGEELLQVAVSDR